MDLVTISSTLAALIGAGLSAFAAWQLVQTLTFVRNSVIVPGEVVAVTGVKDGFECTHAPRIRFRTLAGRDVTFESGLSSLRSAWKVGGEVSVRYQADQPEAAEIDSAVALWLTPCTMGFFALVFWLVGIGFVGGVLA